MLDKYSYDYEWDKEYCYPNSYVLKNKLNIKSQESLSTAEREITSLKIAVAKKNPIWGKFDLVHLQMIHKFIFGDIYMGRRIAPCKYFKRKFVLFIRTYC